MLNVFDYRGLLDVDEALRVCWNKNGADAGSYLISADSLSVKVRILSE
jgi:hypothetical protein